MTRVKSAVQIPILATSLLGLALVALGVGFFAPTGEQSKLMYEGNLWCVSNYIEKEPTEYLDNGQPQREPLLEGKEAWIRRDQVEAGSAEEAMAKATQAEFFERSNKTELRQALQNSDQNFFTHHFNEGATAAGPCWGTGDPANPYVGYWINDAIAAECKGEALPDQSTTSGSTGGEAAPTGVTSGATNNSGSCSYKTQSVTFNKVGTATLPIKSKIVREGHHKTKEENYSLSNTKDHISDHYALTDAFVKNYLGSVKHATVWTPAEGGGGIGDGCCGKPSAAEEPWMVNLPMKANSLAPGTKILVKNPSNGKAVVAVAGYEIGPSNSKKWLIGGQEELMAYLGVSTNSTVEFGFPSSNDLTVGPITCSP